MGLDVYTAVDFSNELHAIATIVGMAPSTIGTQVIVKKTLCALAQALGVQTIFPAGENLKQVALGNISWTYGERPTDVHFRRDVANVLHAHAAALSGVMNDSQYESVAKNTLIAFGLRFGLASDDGVLNKMSWSEEPHER